MSLNDYKDSQDYKDPFSDVATIDIRRKKKISVKLFDSDGDEVDLKEMIDKLNSYITDNLMNEKNNPLKDEISPLITQIFMGSLVYACGHPQTAAFIASQETVRYSITHQMLLSFYFLKFVQKNNLKVVTDETDISDEEIEKIRRINKANSVATMGAMMGVEPMTIIKDMIKAGHLNKEDLSAAMQEEVDNGVLSVSSDDEESLEKTDSSTGTKKKSDPNSN